MAGGERAAELVFSFVLTNKEFMEEIQCCKISPIEICLIS